ncbi:MAG: sulfatase [Thermoplasmata archaeon]
MTGPSSGSPPSSGGGRSPNIVTIILDCARAKNFRTSEGDRVARTPVIDALAAQGTAFPRAVAPANWTVPSHISIFTGSYPNVHGLRTFRRGVPFPDTTATRLKRSGYETAMFSEMVHLVGGYGMEEGFDLRRSRRIGISDEQRTVANSLLGHANFLYSRRVLKLVEKLPPLVAPLTMLNHPQEVAYKADVCGEFTLGYFGDWLRERATDRPFYSFLNFVNVHEPYELVDNGHTPGLLGRAYMHTPRFYLLAVPGLQDHVDWDALVAGYVRSIEEADAKIGRLLALLEQHGERDRTMVVVTADHGQSFGESGNVFHGCGATDSITRVPLVVSPPANLSVPRRVDRWVSLCELDSWIKAVASGGVPYDDAGHAPFPFSVTAPDSGTVFCEGGPASDPNRSLRGIRVDQPWNRRQLAAYRGDEKFVLDLASGEVLRWKVSGDPDLVPATRLVGVEAQKVRDDVFRPYEAQEAARQSEASSRPAAPEVALDARLRSWGYD